MQEVDHIDEVFFKLVNSPKQASLSRTTLYRYDGELPEPKWINGKEGTCYVKI